MLQSVYNRTIQTNNNGNNDMYRATINNEWLSFDYARISNNGAMAIEFINNGRWCCSMLKSHIEYDSMLAQLKEVGALAPIVIKK
jgi:hypothetical protein